VSATEGSAAAGRRLDEDAGGGDHVLRRGAVLRHREEADDRVADLEAAHAVADRVDGAGDVVAGHVRQRHRDRQEAASDAVVGRVERGAGDADEHLARTGDGPVGVLVAQDLGGADLVEANGLHDGLLSVCCFGFEASERTVALLQVRSKYFEFAAR
jgi:hypothetical protein